jgi:ATP-dependent Lhr-like helicase
LPTELATIGELEPDAVDRVHAEIAPVLESADDLRDVLASTLLLRPREDWYALWLELVQRGRGQVLVNDGVQLWTSVELLAEARAALAGEHEAVVHVLRGHLELSGVTSVEKLASATTLPANQVVVGLAALEHAGFAMQGRYSAGARGVEWVARRLLARMHSYSRRARRQAHEAVTAREFMRFLLVWQHVAPDTQLYGEQGLLAVLEQLQGFETAAGAWESEVFRRRLRNYDPAWLDALCHAGEVAWLRLTPRSPDDAQPRSAASPSKATPTAVVLRGDLPWLLAATRDKFDLSGPLGGVAQQVLEFLRERGASFAGDIANGTRQLPEQVERALWDGVARGLVMCDGFAAIRSLLRVGAAPPGSASAWRFSALRRRASSPAAAAGRWSLVPPPALDTDRHDLAEAVAEQLLNRWGVLFRDLARRDSLHLPWREIQWALRRLEDRGLVSGGRFVAGFSGEQYALPAAIEQLMRLRHTPRTQQRVVVNATDPLNLVGVIVPGDTIPAVRTNLVTYIDGQPEDLRTRTG